MRLLVPTDFSDYAKNALWLATKLVKDKTHEIVLFHVIESPSTQSFTTIGLTGIEHLDHSDYEMHIERVEPNQRKY